MACSVAACGDNNDAEAGGPIDERSADGDEQDASSARADSGSDAQHDPDGDATEICVELGYKLDRLVGETRSEGANACTQASDCQVIVTQVSCTGACSVGGFSTTAAGALATRVAAEEPAWCASAKDYGCAETQATCRRAAYEPRCAMGRCDVKYAGCPDSVLELDGKPCSEPGKQCFDSGWCAPTAECIEDEEPGTYRWIVATPLC